MMEQPSVMGVFGRRKDYTHSPYTEIKLETNEQGQQCTKHIQVKNIETTPDI